MIKMEILKKPLFVICLLIILTGVFVLPRNSQAIDIKGELELSENDTKNILHSFIQLFTNELVYLRASADYKPSHQAVLVILKKAIQEDILRYLLLDAPIDVTVKITKNAIKIGRLFYAMDVSVVLEEMEKQTVKMAVEYGMNFLLQNEIRITSGAIKAAYESYKKNPREYVFQYIITFKPAANNQGNMAVEIYSPSHIEPPLNKGSLTTGTPWPISEWLGQGNTELPPFVLTIQGEVKKTELDYYNWTGSPRVEISFPENVPDLGFKPLSFWEKHLWKPLLEKVKEANVVLEKTLAVPAAKLGEGLQSTAVKIGQAIKNTISEVGNKIKSFLAGESPGAQIASPETKIDFAAVPSPTGLGTADTSPKIAETTLILQERGLTLEDLIEQFDEISEQTEIMLAQAEELGIIEKVSNSSDRRDLKLLEESNKKGEKQTNKEATRKETEREDGKNGGNGEIKIGFATQEFAQGEIIFCSVPSSQAPAQNKIIFNEVAWMGTENSPSDEWLELKNVSGNPVELTGWQILDKDEQIKIVFEQTTLIAGGFLLLERGSDGLVPAVPADFFYTGALNNAGEALYLFDKNCSLQDKVEAGSSWPAGNNSSKKTMERKSNFDWQTSQSAGGTPKAENSAGEPVFVPLPAGGGGAPPPPAKPSEQEPKITLSYPGENPVKEEIEVELSVSDLNDALHDIKISIEKDDLLSEIFNEKENKWQSSFYYLTEVFSGSSFSGQFKLRIKEQNKDFRGEADIVAKIRESGKSKYLEYQDKINIAEPENQPPLALFGFSPQKPLAEEKITFDASSSTDPDGQIISFSWDFGDNSSTTTNLATTTHSFSTSSQFQVTLQVTDDQGVTSTATTTIQVAEKLEQKLAQSVVISEIQISDKEFVELYNPTAEAIDISNWYFSYFSSSRDWNKPYRNKKFSEGATTTTIPANGYYLVGLKDYPEENGNPDSDWQIYSSKQLNDTAGAIGIFSCDPSASTTEAGQNCKIDLVSWGQTQVKEGTSTVAHDENKSLTRKQNENGKFIDNNDNSQDFEIKNPTPTNSQGKSGNILPPEPIQNFQVASSTNNTIILTWSTTTDPDSHQENISYFIYQAKTGQDLATSTQTTTTEAVLANLYYDAVYYFSIRAFDGLNWSVLATTSPLAIPLPKITDLNGGTSAVREAIDLFWTSSETMWLVPGEDVKTAKPASYEIRLAEKEIVEQGASENQTNWQEAILIENSISPKEEGEIESFMVENLTPGKIYYFAVKSIGENGTVSEISNMARTKALAGFRDNGDGTVTDLAIGLLWVKDGTSTSSFSGATTTQDNAISFCDGLSFVGYDDWHLPNFKELASILEHRRESVNLNENFVNVEPARHWSSTKIQTSTPGVPGELPGYNGYYIDFSNGWADKDNYEGSDSPGYYLLCVRGQEIPGGLEGDEFDFQDNNDGTVTDNRTGLIWAKAEFSQTGDNRKNWQAAIKFANNRALCQDGTFQGNENETGDCSANVGAKYNDWRLPNLQEIIGVTKRGPSLVLPWLGGLSFYYWSSTVSGENNAWRPGNGYYTGEILTLDRTKQDYQINVQIVRDNF